MSDKVGLWIDSQKAFIVTISQKGEEMRIIRSDIENSFSPSRGGGVNDSYGRKDFPAYDIVDRDIQMHLKSFFDKIIAFVRNADSLYIFGPGEVKKWLKNRIDSGKFMTHNVTLEAADKLSANEVLEKVRHHFPAGMNREPDFSQYRQPSRQ